MIIRNGNQRLARPRVEGFVADRGARQLLAEVIGRERRLKRDMADVAGHQGRLGVAGRNLVWVVVEHEATGKEAESELVRLVRLTGGVCDTIEALPRARVRVLPREATAAMVALATGGLSDNVLASWSELQVCVLARVLVTMCCVTVNQAMAGPREGATQEAGRQL